MAVFPGTLIRHPVRLLPSMRLVRLTTRTRSWQQIQRRTYAEGGEQHGQHKSSSDIPWAIGAIAITVPSCWYILTPDPKKKHGHGHGHGDTSHNEHGGKSEGSEAEGEKSENREEKTEDKNDEEGNDEILKEETGEQTPDESSSTEGSEDRETPDSSDDEASQNIAYEKDSGKNIEGVRFKGATSAGTDGQQGDTRKHIPDAKGYNKLRIESDYGKKQGLIDEESTGQPAASGPPGGEGTMSNKQEGFSNTDTKHSTDITNDPEKSTKGEDAPETAKLKGTVDPSRPLV